MKHIMIEGSFEYVIFFRNFQKKLWTSDVMNFMIMSEFKCLYISIFETAIFHHKYRSMLILHSLTCIGAFHIPLLIYVS